MSSEVRRGKAFFTGPVPKGQGCGCAMCSWDGYHHHQKPKLYSDGIWRTSGMCLGLVFYPRWAKPKPLNQDQ